jgi:threonine dehydrogenase-like Zn-dependent dehydrogenase
VEVIWVHTAAHFAYVSYPRIPGHEFSAEIVEIGQNDLGFTSGMVVTANPYFNCGHCYACCRGLVNACMENQTMGVQRDGAFSQYITMPSTACTMDMVYRQPHLL